MAKIDELDDFHPLTRDEWRAWLAGNYGQSSGIWLVFYKKAVGKPCVAYDDAVEEALCFGWIDSLQRKLDDERSKLLFTPRKSRSVWSKLNKTRIEKLTREGLMTEAGQRKIEAAQRNGSWNTLDDSDNLLIPEDLSLALQENPEAHRYYGTFPDSVKKNILQWIGSAKRDQTRRERIEKTTRMAAVNKRALYDAE